MEHTDAQSPTSSIGSKKKNNKFKQMLLFSTPALLLLLIFFIGPILMTFVFSFTNIALTGASALNPQFIGMENFVSMFRDPSFKNAFINTMVFLVLSAILGQQILGFLIAYLMKEKNRTFRRITGIIFIAGWVTPEVIVGFIFVAFFGDEGTFNHIISWVGIESISWLFVFPMAVIIVANIWNGVAYSMLMFQAALDGVPKTLEEAAMIDGANRWQRLWRVIIPTIKNTFVTNLVIITLNTLGVFTLIYTITGGGPSGQTTTLPLFMYEQAFINYQIGYGTAISLIILLIGIIFSIIYVKSSKAEA